MTAKQNAFILVLADEREISEELHDRLHTAIRTSDISVPQATKIIEWLLAQPKKGETTPPAGASASPSASTTNAPWPDVPQGRYAIDNPGVTGAEIPEAVRKAGVMFLVVDRPDKGRWSGYTFLNVASSDNRIPIKQGGPKRAILQAILDADPEEALKRYGRMVGCCGVCGKALTDETSRSIGIGPTCRKGRS